MIDLIEASWFARRPRHSVYLPVKKEKKLHRNVTSVCIHIQAAFYKRIQTSVCFFVLHKISILLGTECFRKNFLTHWANQPKVKVLPFSVGTGKQGIYLFRSVSGILLVT